MRCACHAHMHGQVRTADRQIDACTPATGVRDSAGADTLSAGVRKHGQPQTAGTEHSSAVQSSGCQARSCTADRAPVSLWYITPGNNKTAKECARTAFAVPATTVLQ